MSFSEVLLPTHLLYKKPESHIYDETKNRFLRNKLSPAYFERQRLDPQKWDELIKTFIQNIPKDKQQLFIEFQTRRKNIQTNNRYNIQLSEMISYFENFYFMYENSEPDFQLSTPKKQKMLNDLMNAMGTGICEPGIITRFEDTLQSVRKDIDWITYELYQQRRNIIHEIADEYNTAYSVPNSMSVHTSMHLSKVSKFAQLGIEPENEIHDAYLSVMSTQPMTDYFNAKYPEKFKQYELDLIKNLSNHFIFEFTQELKRQKINIDNWEREGPILPGSTLGVLNQFTLTMLDETLQPFGTLDEENFLDFHLNNKESCFKVIQNLVKKKLIREKFFVSLDELDHENASNHSIRLPADLNLDELITFKETLSNHLHHPQKIAECLKQHMNIVRHYPDFLTIPLKEHLFLWDSLPRSIKANPIIIDNLIEQLDHLLKHSIEHDHQAEQEKIIALICLIENENPDYLKGLKIETYANQPFSLLLAQKNGRLIQWLPEQLRHDPNVIQTALKTNHLANHADLWKRLSKSQSKLMLKKLYTHCLIINESTPHHKIVNQLEKNESILTLLEKPNISIGQLLNLSKTLSPTELRRVIRQRQELNLPELPHCKMKALQGFMDQFSPVDYGRWEKHGYLAFKRSLTSDATLSHDFFQSKTYQKNLAKHCIQESNQWMFAFLAYQKRIPIYDEAFKNFRDVLLQLKMSANALLDLLKNITFFLLKQSKKLLYFGAIFYASPLITENFWSLSGQIYRYVTDHFGILMPTIIQAISLFIMIAHLMNLGKSGQIITASLIALSAIILPEILILTSIATQVFYAISLLTRGAIKLVSKVIGHELSWNETSTLLSTFFTLYLLSDILFYTAILSSSVHLITNALFIWSRLLMTATLPWVTRAWASLTDQLVSDPLTHEDRIKMEVEENILRLLQDEEPASNQKGTLLSRLWEKIQMDVAQSDNQLSYEQALNKKYSVEFEDRQLTVSFWEISKVPRVRSHFNPCESANQRFSFFGLRGGTKTANSIKKYIDFSEQVPPSDPLMAAAT